MQTVITTQYLSIILVIVGIVHCQDQQQQTSTFQQSQVPLTSASQPLQTGTQQQQITTQQGVITAEGTTAPGTNIVSRNKLSQFYKD